MPYTVHKCPYCKKKLVEVDEKSWGACGPCIDRSDALPVEDAPEEASEGE